MVECAKEENRELGGNLDFFVQQVMAATPPS
jgi:hypothetical protein